MLPILLALTAAFVQGPPWAHFSRNRSLGGVHEVVEIGSGNLTGSSDFRYTMTLTRSGHGIKPATLWADSATCPAMQPLIASMNKIAMPRPAPYGVPGASKEIMVDGTLYELDAPSTDIMGHLTISSNEGTPLSDWINGALKHLEGCWSALPPK